MSEFATYSSIDQDLSTHSRENPNIISYSNDINSYIKSRNNTYSLPLEIKNHKPYITEYDDKYHKKKVIKIILFNYIYIISSFIYILLVCLYFNYNLYL